ncbi:MAG: SDR family NAD(P)-dependent oxidoreductase [Alphaproteobacteria bacterium]
MPGASALAAAGGGFDGGPQRGGGGLRRNRAGREAGGREGSHDPTLFTRAGVINLIGAVHRLRLCANRMVAALPLADGALGVVVTTASIAAEEGGIVQSADAASKGGVAAMTLPAARALSRHGVRVVSIAPGVFGTPMMAGMPEAMRAGLAATLPFPQAHGDPGRIRAVRGALGRRCLFERRRPAARRRPARRV